MRNILLCIICIFPLFLFSQRPGAGNAIELDGVNDYLQFQKSYGNISPPWTVLFWYKPGKTGQVHRFFHSHNNTNGYLGLRINSRSNRLKVTMGDGTGRSPTSRWGHFISLDFKVDRWYHIAAVISSATQVKIWINGNEYSTTRDGGTGNLNIHTDNTKGRIGANTFNGNISYTKGQMDEFSFWSRALSQREIREKMCTKLQGNEPGLLTYYNFDQSGTSTVKDISGNGYDATLVNGPTWQPSSAPVGDVSDFDYSGAAAGLTTAQGDLILAQAQNADTAGIHLYRVDSTPVPAPNNLIAATSNSYYGVFHADNSSTHRFEIKAQSFAQVNLWRRDHNAANNWTMISNSGQIGLYNGRPTSEQYAFAQGCPEMDLLPTDTLVCGSQLVLSAQVNGVQRYEWNTGATGSTISVTTPGTYSVAAFITDSCVVRDTITIQFGALQDPIPQNTFSLCKTSNQVNINLDPTLFTSATWSSGLTGLNNSYTLPGTYWVAAQTTEGCLITDTFKVVLGSTLPFVTVFNDQSFCQGEALTLMAPDSLDVTWPNGRKDSFTVRTSRIVRAEISDGCQEKVELIEVEEYDCDCPMFMPNAFTPNGDGLNEVFKVVNKCQFLSFRMSIYDRWGKLLYYGTNPHEGFDGTHRGKRVPEGLYTYKLQYVLPTGGHIKSGTVMLLR